jgi:hypothetical protein
MGEKGIEAPATSAPAGLAGTSIHQMGLPASGAAEKMASLGALPGVSATPNFGGPSIPNPAPGSSMASSLGSMAADPHRPPTP